MGFLRDEKVTVIEKTARPKVVDVARHAGVSTATVSRVLNNNSRVDPAITARVRASLDELGYRMNSVARSLRRQTNSVIGVVVPDIANPFFTDVVRGIGDALRDDGYMLMLCNSDDDIEREASYLRLLAAQQVSGVIVAPADSRLSDLSELDAAGIPAVVIDRLTGAGGFDSVVFDNRRGAHDLTSRFVEAGRTRIAHVAGPGRTFTGKARREGYLAALATAGIAEDAALIVEADYSEEGGYHAVTGLLDSGVALDAIVVANNAMTLGAIHAMTEHGVDPASVSLASFDPVPWSTSRRYPLLVLDHESLRMGAVAAELLVARIGDPERDIDSRELSPGAIAVFTE